MESSATSPPRVTFILGLCGSGKSWHVERLLREGKAATSFDEGFLARGSLQPQQLLRELLDGKHCVVVEIALCRREVRESFVACLLCFVPNVEITWICIENDLRTANDNCRLRTNKGDPEGHVAINERVSSRYTYPEGAVVLPMWSIRAGNASPSPSS